MDPLRRARDLHHRLLLARARAGHEASLRALYRALYDPVAGYVARRIGSAEDAQDVVAIVFGRFVDRLDHYESSRGSVWTWVMTLARHAVIDHWRVRRPPTEPIEPLADALASDRPDPLDVLVEAEEERLLHGVLRDEPDEVREMFVLHFVDGMRYAEIAKVMGLGESAVKQRFARTLRRLRRDHQSTIEEKGDEHGSIRTAPATADDPLRS